MFDDIFTRRDGRNLLPHNNSLQVNLKISIFWFADPTFVKHIKCSKNNNSIYLTLFHFRVQIIQQSTPVLTL